MFRPFINLCVAVMLTLLVGAHWTVLQSVAWVGMVVTYSQEATLAQAVSKTFDGQHPCKMCKVVQEGKKAEKKQDVLKVEGKKEFFFDSELSVPCPPSSFTLSLAPSESAASLTAAPPVPPPRGLFS